MSAVHHSNRERGQATPLWAAVLVLAGLLLIPVALLTRATLERAEAQNAADATALAWATAGEDRARAVAARNHAEIVTAVAFPGGVEVTVVVGGRHATARAVRESIVVDPTSVRSGP